MAASPLVTKPPVSKQAASVRSVRPTNSAVQSLLLPWGPDTLRIEDATLCLQIRQEAKRCAHFVGSPVLSPNLHAPDGKSSYEYPKPERSMLCEKLLARFLGLELPVALMSSESTYWTRRIVAVRAWLSPEHAGKCYWEFEGYELFANNKLGEVQRLRTEARTAKWQVRQLDCSWRTVRYDPYAPPGAQEFLFANGHLTAANGTVLGVISL